MKIHQSFQFEDIQGFKFGSWPFGKPKMFSHVYFLDGLLVDTGHSNMEKEILSTISELPIKQIFISHHHEDHTGNLTELQKRFNCPTYASDECIEIMKQPPAISFAQWLTWGKSKPNFNIESIGKTLSTDKYNFEVIPVPGHAVDMLCLYEPQKGWLFSADLFVSEYIKYFMRNESMLQQIESIKKVLKLDFDILLCGHNPQFKNGKIRLKNKLTFFEDFYGNVKRRYLQGYTMDAVFKEMELKKTWSIRILSQGQLSRTNMMRAVVRDLEME